MKLIKDIREYNSLSLAYLIIVLNFLDWLSTQIAVNLSDMGWLIEGNEWVRVNMLMGYGFQIINQKLIMMTFAFLGAGYVGKNSKWGFAKLIINATLLIGIMIYIGALIGNVFFILFEL